MNTQPQQSHDLTSQHGNVLFLILIAVVLFAALSYAVTQSSRTGGGDAGRETNLIGSAEVTQYPAAIKTSIVRMIINGISYEQLKFNPPSDFAGLGSELTEGVFHPVGGGAAYAPAGANVMSNGTPGPWYFNASFEVENIGTSSAGNPDGNDFIAFLPGIKAAICDKLNEETNGITTIPVASAIASTDVDVIYDDAAAETIPNENAEVIGVSAGTTTLSGQAAGCFRGSDGVYVYYQVVGER
jgi:hypothetical protein